MRSPDIRFVRVSIMVQGGDSNKRWTLDFISIDFDIRLKNRVAISTVENAKFEVCKYT